MLENKTVHIDPACSKCGRPMPHKEGCTFYLCMACNTANVVEKEEVDNFGGIEYKETVVKNPDEPVDA